eukprot:8936513-Ditylum_brightwellii.AAC.1
MRSIWSNAKGLLLAQESTKEKTATLPNAAALTFSDDGEEVLVSLIEIIGGVDSPFMDNMSSDPFVVCDGQV